MVVVDTTVWIDYIHGLDTSYTNALDYELLHNQVITGDLLMTEFFSCKAFVTTRILRLQKK